MAEADAKVVTAQTDFSAGQLDASSKRDNDVKAVKSGLRQCANMRILSTRKLTNRPGRRALYVQSGRVDQVRMDPTHTFDLCFSANTITIRDSAGTVVFTQGGFGWLNDTVHLVSWDVYLNTIVIAFPSGAPQTLIWAGGSSWSLAGWDSRTVGTQKRTAFYRFAAAGITMTPSATTGGISVTFSAPVLSTDPAYLGTRFRYVGRQLTITGVSDSLHGVAGVQETLPPGQSINFATDPTGTYSVGDVVEGVSSGAKGYVVAVFAGNMIVQLLTQNTSPSNLITTPNSGGSVVGFNNGEVVVGQSGAKTNTTVVTIAPQPVPTWDEEAFNTYRGWPQSVLVDQNRLCFTDIPSVPSGIAWSAVGDIYDFYIDSNPENAIFELVPSKSRVFHVAVNSAAAGDEIVLTDTGIYYIPISETNPLKPGSVAFKKISPEPVAQVRPQGAPEGLICIGYGRNRVLAVVGTGTQTRQYQVDDISERYSDLFSAGSLKGIAVATGDTFAERYIYVIDANGTVTVGRFDISNREGARDLVACGWAPWSGNGTPNWVTALNSVVIFTTNYFGTVLAERLDTTLYLDGAIPYNSAPAALAPPGGKGPLWFIGGTTVDLMDQTTRFMGTYAIDANGFLVPQGNAGENFALASLIAGQAWTATVEPFIPPVQAGQDVGQRMWPRRISRAQVYVSQSSGFTMVRLYSGQSGPNLPTPGTVMKVRRIPAWNVDENPTQAPRLREQSYLDRPIGRAHDPRWAIVKDTPGPLTIEEISTEVGV